MNRAHSLIVLFASAAILGGRACAQTLSQVPELAPGQRWSQNRADSPAAQGEDLPSTLGLKPGGMSGTRHVLSPTDHHPSVVARPSAHLPVPKPTVRPANPLTSGPDPRTQDYLKATAKPLLVAPGNPPTTLDYRLTVQGAYTRTQRRSLAQPAKPSAAPPPGALPGPARPPPVLGGPSRSSPQGATALNGTQLRPKP
jgi:hypothetical protein